MSLHGGAAEASRARPLCQHPMQGLAAPHRPPEQAHSLSGSRPASDARHQGSGGLAASQLKEIHLSTSDGEIEGPTDGAPGKRASMRALVMRKELEKLAFGN